MGGIVDGLNGRDENVDGAIMGKRARRVRYSGNSLEEVEDEEECDNNDVSCFLDLLQGESSSNQMTAMPAAFSAVVQPNHQIN